MTSTTLGMLARTTRGRLIGADAEFNGVCTDTRKLVPGQLYVALAGPNFDGHDFVQEAQRIGAAGVMVGREVHASLPQVVVASPVEALGTYAKAWRIQFNMPVIGLTGSNGKTTTKEMTAAILRERGHVLSTQGNLNNHIGVPLTLLRLDETHVAAVVEMGANHAGEIAYLAGLALPDVGMITNAGPSHLEGFGSLAGVAEAKGEIYAALADDGCAVINANDVFAPRWRELSGNRRRLEFGIDVDADFSTKSTSIDRFDDGSQRFELTCASGTHQVTVPLPGRHNVMNALAAAAAAGAVGASAADIVAGLAKVSGVKGRLQRHVAHRGAVVIDDTYNANPASLSAAIFELVATAGRHWLVLGDMGELGHDAPAMHEQAGITAREAGIERLFTIGPLSARATEAFGAGAEHFDDIAGLSERLVAELAPGVTVLIKGSRSMRMERVVAALRSMEN